MDDVIQSLQETNELIKKRRISTPSRLSFHNAKRHMEETGHTKLHSYSMNHILHDFEHLNIYDRYEDEVTRFKNTANADIKRHSESLTVISDEIKTALENERRMWTEKKFMYEWDMNYDGKDIFIDIDTEMKNKLIRIQTLIYERGVHILDPQNMLEYIQGTRRKIYRHFLSETECIELTFLDVNMTLIQIEYVPINLYIRRMHPEWDYLLNRSLKSKYHDNTRFLIENNAIRGRTSHIIYRFFVSVGTHIQWQ